MVLLVEKLGRSLKFGSKLQNPKVLLSASMQAFESEISSCLIQLSLNSNPRSEILNFSWIRRSLQQLPIINKAFAKLVVDIDYPMSRWEHGSVEEYLKYSLRLLEELNSISSALSHLGQAQLSLSHAISLVENSPSLAVEKLKTIPTIRPRSPKNCRVMMEEKEGNKRNWSGNELIIHQALTVMKSVGYWVCGVVISSLHGETTTSSLDLDNSTLMSLDSRIREEMMVRGGGLKEVNKVNDGVACIVADIKAGRRGGDMAGELRERVKMFGKFLDGAGEDVDKLFSEVLVGRNELLNNLGGRKE